MSLNAFDLTPHIGSRIEVDKAGLVGGAYSEEIRMLLRERGVLVARGLHLDAAEQRAFSETLGRVKEADDDGLQNISLDRELNASAEYLKGSFFWHIDGSNDDVPNFAATLTAKRLSETGGTTCFASTYAAYEGLSDEDKERCAGLRVVHDLYASQRMVKPEFTMRDYKAWRSLPAKVHPLVWTHETGRKSLILGASADYVEDMERHASRELLCRLRDWATRDEFVYRHEWELGDLLVWDNTGTMHRVEPYPIDSGRLLIRTTIDGHEAIR